MREPVIVRTAAQAAALVARVTAAKAVGYDTESSGPLLVGLKGKKKRLNMYRATLTGFSVSTPGETDSDPKYRWYIPLTHVNGENCPRHIAASVAQACAAATRLVAHSWDHDLLASRELIDFRGSRLACTCVMAWLAQVSNESFGLKQLVKELFGREMATFQDVTKGRQSQELAPEEMAPYASQDAVEALNLFEYLTPKLEALGLLNEFYDVEMPFLEVVRNMEDKGLAIDAPYLIALHDELTPKIEQLSADWDWLVGGDINSMQQVSKAMYDNGHWDKSWCEAGKNGCRSVAAEFAEVARVNCKPGSIGRVAADLLLEYRETQKMVSTYTLGFVEKAQQYPDGRLHSSFCQHGTVTGRLSSSYPNLQNLPAHGGLARRLMQGFVPAPGNVFLAGDYSQIDLRLLAHLSQDTRMVEAYRKGADFHQVTADSIGTTRDMGKRLNLAISYGAREKKLMKSAGVTKAEATRLLDGMADAYPGLGRLRERASRVARERGYIKTLLGRIRYIPELHSSSKMERWKGERFAMNTPAQGGSRDVVTLGMLAVARNMGDVQVSQVHDDVITEIPEETATVGAEILKHSLESCYSLRVPLVVEPRISHNLAK